MSHSTKFPLARGLLQTLADEWGLPEKAIEEFLQRGVQRRYERRASILPQGAVRDTVFVLLDGEVSISVFLPDGRRILCGLYRPGTIFGFPLVESERPRWSAAEAFTDATVCVLARRDFEAVLAAQPAVTVMRFFNRVLMRKARFAMRLLHCLVLDLPGRLALTLLDLGHTFGTTHGNELHIALPLTHELLAEMVGASRERVSKAMADFAARGYVRYDRKQIVLCDRHALEEIAQPRAMPLSLT
jgi:CRP/FNR family transcriptional regulator